MRKSSEKRSNKSSKCPAVIGRTGDSPHADDHAAITAALEKYPFFEKNTAGGRKPPYKPEYAERAKAMCERGATMDELAEHFEVSPVIVRSWYVSHSDFFEACGVSPGCVERVKRVMFDSGVGQKVVAQKIVESGIQRQTTTVTKNLPANIGAARSFVPDEVVPVEGELKQLLRELRGTRVYPKFTGPDGRFMTTEEHFAIGGHVGAGEVDWDKVPPEEISRCNQILSELRRKS